ncbi:MAG: helix-turn-helix transcriptional regulator [Anaerolineales bacterium]
MRADRLIAILMLLQARGRMTAEALAEELEVSIRTIYRDLEALGTAGVPVYAERGPGGGCALLDSYRTHLTGLTEDEIQALFTLEVPASLADLGMGGDLKAALRKLAAALPRRHQEQEPAVRNRIHLDWSGWERRAAPVPHLRLLQRAVWENRKLRLTYRLWFGTELEQQVAPYGLVAKAGVWYLVYCRKGRVKVREVVHIRRAALTERRFERPRDFDLAAFWERWCAEAEAKRPAYPVNVRVPTELIPHLPSCLGERVQVIPSDETFVDKETWTPLTLTFESLEEARGKLLALGRAVEVLEPEPLRLSLVDFARQIVELYAEKERTSSS